MVDSWKNGVGRRSHRSVHRPLHRLIEHLVHAGGKLLRAPDVPPPGGLRGYVADPDDHIWEIAYNPAWRIDPTGWVHFGV